MNKTVQELLTELKRLSCPKEDADTVLDEKLVLPINERTASQIYAWCEQKFSNEMVREGRRTGSCPVCGSQAYEHE